MGTRGLGTGFHVKAKSGKTYILTNFHVCFLADKNGYMNALTDKTFQRVKVIRRSNFTDLCLLTPVKMT